MSITWIQTYTGRKFDLLNPTPDMVCIEDVAHSLAHQCRFNGHLNVFYSVAEHSWRMALQFRDPWLSYQALLHDAHEAYLGDITSPLKNTLNVMGSDTLNILEQNLATAVRTKFQMPLELFPRIKEADWKMCVTEAHKLHGPPPEPWFDPEDRYKAMEWKRFGLSPKEAQDLFLMEYRTLCTDLNARLGFDND